MNLKVGLMFIMYYGIIAVLFIALRSLAPTQDIGLYHGNMSDVSTTISNDNPLAFLNVINFIFSLLAFLILGIGLPAATPMIAMICFSVFQTGVTIFAVMFVVSSVWDG